ncbi:hypothetical protein MPNTM1_03150 [Mycolicibacterium parafortuitum]|uniref:oligosaccharide flippase family protein n=1 Tax=Mycolicibacterium parafortuitum TaxID=39692 RepID=UPI0032C49C6A
MRRDFAFTAVSIASRLLVSTFLFILLARLWGPGQFGVFTYVFSVCALLMLIVDFGFSTFLIREIAAEPERAVTLIAQGLRAKLLLTGVMTVVALGPLLILDADVLPRGMYVLLLLSTLALSFAEFCSGPLRALGRYDLETMTTAVGNGFQFAAAGGVAWLGGTPTEVAGAMLLSRCVFFAATWWALARVVPLRSTRPVDGDTRGLLRQLWPYGVDGAMTAFWNLIDIVAIRSIFGDNAVGLYAAGQKYVQGAAALTPLVGNVMIPQLAQRSQRRAPDTRRVACLAGLLMLGVGALLAAPLFLFPQWVSAFLFGPDYASLARWLPLFGAILLARFFSAAFGMVLTAIGLQSKRVIGQVIALACYGVAILGVAVSGWGVAAAIAAMLFATLALGIAHAILLLKAASRGLAAPQREA